MTAPLYETLTIAHTDGVAVLTLNRPHVLNAFDGNMVREMDRAITSLLDDRSVRSYNFV